MFLKAENIVSELKQRGLTFEERVAFLGRIVEITKPSLKKAIQEWDEELRTNPQVTKDFTARFRLKEFVPLFGLSLHEKAKEVLRDKHAYFFHRVNMNKGFVAKAKERLFWLYHTISFSIIATEISAEIIKRLR